MIDCDEGGRKTRRDVGHGIRGCVDHCDGDDGAIGSQPTARATRRCATETLTSSGTVRAIDRRILGAETDLTLTRSGAHLRRWRRLAAGPRRPCSSRIRELSESANSVGRAGDEREGLCDGHRKVPLWKCRERSTIGPEYHCKPPVPSLAISRCPYPAPQAPAQSPAVDGKRRGALPPSRSTRRPLTTSKITMFPSPSAVKASGPTAGD